MRECCFASVGVNGSSMSIDSLEKRRNVPGVGRPWLRAQHPVATPDKQWRAAVGLSYGGAFGAAAIRVRYRGFTVNVGRLMNQ